MAIDTLRLVRIEASYEDVFPMLEMIHNSQGFHPELASSIINQGNGGLNFPNNKIFENFHQRIDKLADDLDLEFSKQYDRRYSKDEIEQAIFKTELMIHKNYDPGLERLLDEDDKIAIKRLKEYPFSLDDMGYLNLKFGKVSNQKAAQLYFYKDKPFIFTRLHNTKRNSWIACLSTNENEAMLDDILEAVDFESVHIPTLLKERVDTMTHQLLDNIYGYVLVQAKIESYLKYVAMFNDRAVLTGFISVQDLDGFKSIFDERFIVQDFPAESESGLMPPTKLNNRWFSKPFKLFVDMYGLPQYGSFDPTTFFAITYSFMFGMMFGDVGQGLVLLGLGIYMAKKSDLGGIMIRLSISSIIFGFIYGSFFRKRNTAGTTFKTSQTSFTCF